MFSMIVGRKAANEIADHIGVDRALFSSALLESGTTWAHLKTLKQLEYSIDEAAKAVLPSFEKGLIIIRDRFGEQTQIRHGFAVIRSLNAKWGHSDMPIEDEVMVVLADGWETGRYQLSYPAKTNEMVNGRPVGSDVFYAMRSDNLDGLQGLALVKKLGGVDVSLIDTTTGQSVLTD